MSKVLMCSVVVVGFLLYLCGGVLGGCWVFGWFFFVYLLLLFVLFSFLLVFVGFIV